MDSKAETTGSANEAFTGDSDDTVIIPVSDQSYFINQLDLNIDYNTPSELLLHWIPNGQPRRLQFSEFVCATLEAFYQ